MGKDQFSFQSQRSNAKVCSNYHTTAIISHASKFMLKILQARLQQYRNQELSDVISWVSKRQRTYTCPGLMYYIREESD